jgi:glycosyltransferase involved in cell wall biosynthesis
MKHRTAIVICIPDPSGNPRPRRMIELMQSLGYRVDVASAKIRGDIKVENSFVIPSEICRLLLWGKVIRKSASIIFNKFNRVLICNKHKSLVYNIFKGTHNLSKILRKEYDVIVVEDIELLPVAYHGKRKAKLIFDAREYYPKQRENIASDKLKAILWICNQYLSRCDVVLTVSNGLANEYQKEFGINPVLYRSTPNFQNVAPRPVNPEKIMMVHHGAADRHRKIENMIEIVNKLDERFHLDLYLLTNKQIRDDYLKELKELVANNPRIRFYNPVPFNDIIPMLNIYDIGLYFLEPAVFNLQFALPNKFFEFVQGRLMLAIGPSPDMAELVQQYNCGVVSERFDTEELAGHLNKLNAKDIEQFKRNSHKAAQELCFEAESKKFITVLNNNK